MHKFPMIQLLAITTLLAVIPQSTSAATCSTPNLAAGYCDRNGDMVADSPDDKAQWINPPSLVISDVPTSDMVARAEQLAPFVKHLSKSLGRPVEFLPVQDYIEQMAAFKSGRVHIVNINTGMVEQAVRCEGYVPLAQPVDEKGQPLGTRASLIVPAASKIKTVKDIKGKTITFVNEQSNSGYKAPRLLLEREFGLRAERDYRVEFSGRQDTSILGVAQGIHEAAVVGSSSVERLIREKLVSTKDFRVIYQSPVFPKSPWGVSHRLSPDLAAAIRKAILSYRNQPGIANPIETYHAANYRTDWAIVRDINNAIDTGTRCP